MFTNKYARRKNRLPWQSRMVAGTCLTFLMAATAYGQDAYGKDQEKSNAIAPAHPAHTAPKKVYTPASVHALPGLQCQLYPTGSEPSTGLEVYTNDDGYARFHAVRAAAGDGVQQ